MEVKLSRLQHHEDLLSSPHTRRKISDEFSEIEGIKEFRPSYSKLQIIDDKLCEVGKDDVVVQSEATKYSENESNESKEELPTLLLQPDENDLSPVKSTDYPHISKKTLSSFGDDKVSVLANTLQEEELPVLVRHTFSKLSIIGDRIVGF